MPLFGEMVDIRKEYFRSNPINEKVIKKTVMDAPLP